MIGKIDIKSNGYCYITVSESQGADILYVVQSILIIVLVWQAIWHN